MQYNSQRATSDTVDVQNCVIVCHIGRESVVNLADMQHLLYPNKIVKKKEKEAHQPTEAI